MPDLLHYHPSISPAGADLYARIVQHPDAPPWNTRIGDAMRADDHAVLSAFRATLCAPDAPLPPAPPSSPDGLPLDRWRRLVPWFRDRAPVGRPWAEIPCSSREDLSRDLVDFLPDELPEWADLSRLIRYDTSGTTGQPLALPSHPATVSANHALLDWLLRLHGVALPRGPRPVGAHVCAQHSTFTFTAVLSMWGDAAFCKVNLNPREWHPDSARRFLQDLDPPLISSDPPALAALLRLDPDIRPRAVLSGASALPPGLRAALLERYGCPVLDWYSLTETGPVAAAVFHPGAPDSPGDGTAHALLCPDLYVEITDPYGYPLPDGEHGEITVSGGRNPYLPLLRYRTGDHARLSSSGQGRLLLGLQGRAPVGYRAADGLPVTPMDLARPLHRWRLAAHEFRQLPDGTGELTCRPVPGWPVDVDQIRQDLERILQFPVRVATSEDLGAEQKAVEWR